MTPLRCLPSLLLLLGATFVSANGAARSGATAPAFRPGPGPTARHGAGLAVASAAGASAQTALGPITLAGQWRVRIDEGKVGVTERWHASELAGGQALPLPGTIDDAGLGPKNTKPPTLEGPYRLYDYAGPVWYQREIEIPAAWRGQRVTLFLERCRWVTTVWLDDRCLGSQDSLSAPHLYDLGAGVAPGRHRLTICVDNTVKLNLGRFVSALFGGTSGNMNGIVGRIELAATPPVWLDDVQVHPDFAKRTARVKVRIGNATGQAGRGELAVGGQRVPAVWDASGGQAEVELDLATVKPWDEFSPNLTEVTVQLGAHGRTVRFGLREFAPKATQFTLNGRPIYLRGTLECSVWPLTGYPPTEVPAWRRIYRIMKSYGLNHLRFHSWCPPEAAFAAADEEGILLQPEGPQANVPAGADPARDAFIEAEFKRIVDTYGNHPSFCLMALGNEYGGDEALLTRWVGMLRERDPRHLYTAASNNRFKPANRQFTVAPQGRGIPESGTIRDLRDVVAADPHPVIGHEIGQWMYFPDFAEMKKYTGVLAPRNFELIRADLEKKQLLDLAPQYVQASGRFATRLYKEEIEVLLRTPGYAGFALLDLHDYPTQGTALIGPLDPFWDSKGFITPEAWRRFCGPTVPLLRMPKRVFAAAEPFEATAELAHFGRADLPFLQPRWTIKDSAGRVIAAGALPAVAALTGRLTGLGAIRASLAGAVAPSKLTVAVELPGTEFANDWDIWVYPAGDAPPPPPGVAICENWNVARTALDEGRKVVYFAHGAHSPQSLRGRFLPVFWSPVWFPTQKPNTMGLLCDPRQPLFARFPTDIHSDWQWYGLMQRSRVFVLDDTPPAYRPTLQVIDNFARNQKLGVVFEGRARRGELLVCGFDLPALREDLAGRQFLASLYAYVGSAAFRPAQSLSEALLDQLFVPKFANKLQELDASIRGRSHSRDYAPDNAIDGDPKTMWHTSWDDPAQQFPHELVVQLPKPVRLTGLTCLPRQDGNRNGWIKDYAVHVSADGRNWGAPVAEGTFPRDDALKTIRLARPVEARFIKFVARSGFDPTKGYASLAELSVMIEP